ncbi:MAG: ABC transporter substrate-binding protein [Vicinamibacteria bacterium]
MRIVSLLPAATEIVCALGLRENLVGRSHECDFPADVSGLPALTRSRVDSSLPSEALDARVRELYREGVPLYELDEKRLQALAPDVVVTQEACEVCAVSLGQVQASLARVGSRARIVPLRPSRLAHVVDDVERVAEACGMAERGHEVAHELRRRLDRYRSSQNGGVRPRVAMIEWLEPPMLAGHWMPEAIEAAGGIALGPTAGAASPYTSWDELKSLRPDAVVVAPCGFDLARTRAEALPLAARLRALAPRTLLVDGNAYFNRPGPRLVDAVELLGAWLRGDAAPYAGAVPLSVLGLAGAGPPPAIPPGVVA